MFNLEQSIAEWREQMLSAGIDLPELLDELENHLREDIGQQIRSGTDSQQAFEAAVIKMGYAASLKTEYAKMGNRFDPLTGGRARRSHRILGLLWMAGCLWSLSTIGRQFVPANSYVMGNGPVFYTSLLAICIYGSGLLGGAFLTRGLKLGTRIVRMMALLFLFICVAQVLATGGLPLWRGWCGIFAVFCLVSLWLLRPSKVQNSSFAKN
jgi:hypothetical protein